MENKGISPANEFLAIAAVLEEAQKAASEAALKLIRETFSWDQCDPHRLYHSTEARILKPYVDRAVLSYGEFPIVRQYSDGLITGREMLTALILRV